MSTRSSIAPVPDVDPERWTPRRMIAVIIVCGLLTHVSARVVVAHVWPDPRPLPEVVTVAKGPA